MMTLDVATGSACRFFEIHPDVGMWNFSVLSSGGNSAAFWSSGRFFSSSCT